MMTDTMIPDTTPTTTPDTTGDAAQHAPTPRRRRSPALRVWGGIRSAILTATAVVGVLCALAFGASLLFGLKPLAVISGSMEPTIPVGSLVISQPVPASEVGPGDIVTVERPRDLGLVTHRVVSNEAVDGDIHELVLKGDANDTEDPEPYDTRTVGKYLMNIPFAGTFSMFIRTPAGLMSALAAGLVLIAVFMLDPSRLERRPDDEADVDA